MISINLPNFDIKVKEKIQTIEKEREEDIATLSIASTGISTNLKDIDNITKPGVYKDGSVIKTLTLEDNIKDFKLIVENGNDTESTIQTLYDLGNNKTYRRTKRSAQDDWTEFQRVLTKQDLKDINSEINNINEFQQTIENDYNLLKDSTKKIEYEFFSLLDGTRINKNDKEYRIMFKEDTLWTMQSGGAGENYNPNRYYFAMKAYAPNDDVTGFKEALDKKITNESLDKFENNPFAGIDDYGRKYSLIWLPAAEYEDGKWSYFGKNSTNDHYIGWYYTVEWYKGNEIVASDTIRINLTNKGCHNNVEPFYMENYIKLEDIEIEPIPIESIQSLKWTSTFDEGGDIL